VDVSVLCMLELGNGIKGPVIMIELGRAILVPRSSIINQLEASLVKL
jgi:hypothetical protein